MAIARVAGSDLGQAANASSLTTAFTVVNGMERLLVVLAYSNKYTDTFVGVTYNGVAMTAVTSSYIKATGGGSLKLYYMVNPPVGTYNVVVTTGTGTYIGATATEYVGVDQRNPIDTSGNAGDINQTSLTSTWSVGRWGNFLVGGALSNNNPVAGTNTVFLYGSDTYQYHYMQTTVEPVPSGNNSFNTTYSSANYLVHSVASLNVSPLAAGFLVKMTQ
jgi:hypothetical protein